MLKERSSRIVCVLVVVAAMSAGMIAGYIGSTFVDRTNSAMPQQSEKNNLFVKRVFDTFTLELKTAADTKKQTSDYPVSVTLETPIESEKSPKAGTVEKYVIREYSEQIAVYEFDVNGDSTITNLLGVDISTLPDHDRESLKEGIVVYSEEEMLQLLEDYMS